MKKKDDGEWVELRYKIPRKWRRFLERRAEMTRRSVPEHMVVMLKWAYGEALEKAEEGAEGFKWVPEK